MDTVHVVKLPVRSFVNEERNCKEAAQNPEKKKTMSNGVKNLIDKIKAKFSVCLTM